MKKLLLVLSVLLVASSMASAQEAYTLANCAATGTTLNTLTKRINSGGNSCLVIMATTDTTGASGITTKGNGTTGLAELTRGGVVPCLFDNATTAEDYVQISSVTAGNCRDVGATRPTSGQIIGRVIGTGGGAGPYNVALDKDIYPASAVGTTLLNSQGPLTAVTGTGAAANIYTFSIPGNTMSTTSCIRATAFFHHSTGSASVPYSWNFGGTSLTFAGNTGSNQAHSSIIVCNNGATNVQYLSADIIIATAVLTSQIGTAAVDTTTAQSISLQFNVAATDAAKPDAFVVESVH